MQRSSEWNEFWTKRLEESEKELANFRHAISKHGLRVFTRDTVNGEKDVTDEHIEHMEAAVAEYRAMLRDD